MPEPAPTTVGVPLQVWPDYLPNPQAPSMTVLGPPRVAYSGTLSGPMRARVHARTAPASYGFACWFTQKQMQDFEGWYKNVVANHDGEFYARWIGGSRVVAFGQPYEYSFLGAGYVLRGTVIRTRIDESACDDFLNSVFGNIYRDEGASDYDILASLTATDRYVDQFSLKLIADNEC